MVVVPTYFNNLTRVLNDEGRYEDVEMMDKSKMTLPLVLLYFFSACFLVSFLRAQCMNI
jgi:hypothetical protein